MADDDMAKRLKLSEDVSVLDQRDRRIAELESEIAQLRQRVQQLESNHEALPVST